MISQYQHNIVSYTHEKSIENFDIDKDPKQQQQQN